MLTDIASGWTEAAPIVVSEGSLLVETLDHLRAGIPFGLRVLDVDNGTEFVDHRLIEHCLDTATFPAGAEAGFIIADGQQLLILSLLSAVQIQTLLDGQVQETATTVGLGDVLQVQAAGLLAVNQYAGYAGFPTTKKFNGVQILAGSLLALNSNLHVYAACVSH